MAITSIANPLYDTAFKYLMEDNRVAQLLIGALINKKIKTITQTANEITDWSNDGLKLLRLDFSAEVEIAPDKFETITIEVQKVFLATEYVRFRKYLSEQYANRANKKVSKEYKDRKTGKIKTKIVEKALPITAIYILGHSTIDDQHPVIYGEGAYRDVEGNIIEKIGNCEFLTSMMHKIIVVQVPSLKKKPRTYVEKLLSLFDQSNVSSDTDQILNIEPMEDHPEGYDEILKRLEMAAKDKKLRRKMQHEQDGINELKQLQSQQEWLESQLYDAKEAIAKKDETIAKKDEAIAKKDEAIAKKDETIAKKDEAIAKKDKAIAKKDEELAAANEAIASAIKALKIQNLPSSEIAKIFKVSIEMVESIK